VDDHTARVAKAFTLLALLASGFTSAAPVPKVKGVEHPAKGTIYVYKDGTATRNRTVSSVETADTGVVVTLVLGKEADGKLDLCGSRGRGESR
jgi:hypothetical protein